VPFNSARAPVKPDKTKYSVGSIDPSVVVPKTKSCDDRFKVIVFLVLLSFGFVTTTDVIVLSINGEYVNK
jgi:hypothetical protein